MTTRTAAINRALIKLGVQTVTSEDEETEAARKAKIVFDTACRGEIRRHAWSFAMARARLAADATTPAYGWTYAYQLPADWLRCVQVGDYYEFAHIRVAIDQPVVPYTIEGQKLFTNLAAPLNFRYLRDLSANPAAWDACFFEAFAARLAMELAPTLTKSANMMARARQDYKESILEAKRSNAIELPPQPLPANSWEVGRI